MSFKIKEITSILFNSPYIRRAEVVNKSEELNNISKPIKYRVRPAFNEEGPCDYTSLIASPQRNNLQDKNIIYVNFEALKQNNKAQLDTLPDNVELDGLDNQDEQETEEIAKLINEAIFKHNLELDEN